MMPKFSLEQRTVYRANGSTKTSTETLFKMVGDAIQPNTEETASCNVVVPDTAIYTLHNCEILSVECYIKVCNSEIAMLHELKNSKLLITTAKHH